MSEIYGLDHVQIAIPSGQEGAARAFYSGVLGLEEEPKPEHLAARGGAWFRSGALSLHLGVDHNFTPSKKAHPALLVRRLSNLVSRCKAAGYEPIAEEPLDGYQRVYVSDPFGNRIELMEKKSDDGSDI